MITQIKGKYGLTSDWLEDFDIEIGDSVSCYPYRSIFYTIYGFDNHNDTNVVTVVGSGNAMLSILISNITEVFVNTVNKKTQQSSDIPPEVVEPKIIEPEAVKPVVVKPKPPVRKPKRKSRIQEALDQSVKK